MKLLLDACVLYPTVMREVLLGVAKEGVFEPLWSERLLEEWARAAARHGSDQEAQARSEIALANAAFPSASVSYSPSLEARLWLPDANDTHVLAAAISGSAERIITLNKKDFPKNILAEEGVGLTDPDAFLHGVLQFAPDTCRKVANQVLQTANILSGDRWDMRSLMKKARMPRFGKALTK